MLPIGYERNVAAMQQKCNNTAAFCADIACLMLLKGRTDSEYTLKLLRNQVVELVLKKAMLPWHHNCSIARLIINTNLSYEKIY